jgi:hypothetical protein
MDAIDLLRHGRETFNVMNQTFPACILDVPFLESAKTVDTAALHAGAAVKRPSD